MESIAGLTLKELIVGIAAALIVAGLGFIGGRARGRIEQRANERRLLRDLGAFGTRMLDAGVTNFYIGRDDWARYREPADLGAYLRQAEHSVEIACYWMAQGVLAGIPSVLADIAEAGRNVRVVTLDPGSRLIDLLTVDLEMPANDIRQNVRNTQKALRSVKSNLSTGARTRFHICTTPVLPQAAVILLDRNHQTSILQLEFRPYRTARAHSFAMELKARDGAKLHAELQRSWIRFFDDANVV